MELRAGFRDRQALVYAVLVPLFLYPVIFWAMLQGFLVVQGQRERTAVRVALHGADATERARLEEALAVAPPERPPGAVELSSVDELAQAQAALGAGEFDLVLALKPEGGASELFFDAARSRSTLARARIGERLEALAAKMRLDAVAGDLAALEPYRFEPVPLASKREESAFILSFLLPMMFCIMSVLGGLFSAIDLTAGEKERRTAETTLLLPIPRVQVLLGKLLVVTCFSTLAALLNVTGLLAAAEHLLSGLDADGFSFSVPWSAFPKALPLLLCFLVSTSALLLGVACLADTFKQGQALLGPVQVFVLLPAVFASMPGIRLTPALALVPVAQTALAFKGILQAEVEGRDLALAYASQVAYGALAIALALRLGTRETLLLGAWRRSKR
jgi:sodium transport system permease protein